MKNESKWNPTTGGHGCVKVSLGPIGQLRRASGNILGIFKQIVNSYAKAYNSKIICRDTKTRFILHKSPCAGCAFYRIYGLSMPHMSVRVMDLGKKKEASAGSGGTAVHALAGGGNQSLLTATAACLGERRVPQSSIATYPMPTLFLDARKKNRKSQYAPTCPKIPPSLDAHGNTTPFFSLGPRTQARSVPLVAVLSVLTLFASMPYAANGDLVPEKKAQESSPAPEAPATPKPLPLERLRDTVYGLDVRWPGDADRQFSDDASVALQAMTQDPDPETRIQGLLGLADAAAAESVTLLVNALDDPAPEVREIALQKLGILDTERLVRELVARLASHDEFTRWSVDRALPQLKPRIEAPMLSLLDAPDMDPGTRIVAARALGAMGSEEAVPSLSRAAFETTDTGLAQAAAEALAVIASPNGLPALQELSRYPDARVRAEALTGLARIGGPVALSAIEAMALDPHESDIRNRREAIRYIGLLGGERSIETLINTMNRYPQTRETVVVALTRLTGLNLGNSPLEWTRWYHERQKAMQEAQHQESTGGLLGVIPSSARPPAAETPPQ